MQIRHVDNSWRWSDCPFCSSNLIFKVGTMKNRNPMLFSTSWINLNNSPEFWKCKSCLSYFNQNIVCESDAVNFYLNNKTNKWNAVEFELEKTNELVLEIKKYLFEGAQVLDIGCNTGELLDFCKKNGAETTGIEYSELCRKICSEKGHKTYFSFNEIERDRKYDIIFAFDLFEHTYDIKNFFNKVRINLKKDGILILLTGNPDYWLAKILKEKWWYFALPEHIVFPSKEYFNSLQNLQLVDYVSIYNSVRYFRDSLFHFDFNFLLKIKNILWSLLRGYYEYSFPLIGPDHALVIMKKNEN